VAKVFRPERWDTPEFAVLVRCLEARWHPEALEQARALIEDDFDWDRLVDLAVGESVGPLLYAAVQGAGWVSSSVLSRLRRVYVLNGAQAALRFHDLEAVLTALHEVGVPVIALKGAALAETVYGNAALRPMDDADLLVPHAQGGDAVACLVALGYELFAPEARKGDALAYENEVMLVRREERNLFQVELHWSLFDAPHYQSALPMDWFWSTARPARIGGVATQILGPEAQLLHLCGHAVLHHGGAGGPPMRLCWLHDVAEVIFHYEEDIQWDLLLARAQRCDLVLPVQMLLPEIGELWNLDLPISFQGQLRSLVPSPAEVRVYAMLTGEPRPVLRRFVDDLRGFPSWRDRLTYAWHAVFPSPSYMGERYHVRSRWLLPMTYPYRWLYGIRTWVSVLSNGPKTGVIHRR